ncbi:beta strand repeat-containing protein [Dichotomicrobium thermohalophilum]|uniref:Uncharacterized protein n=1 Tax=Dichotomicrobium thermohalophilum TaxID=933063 RepID=A0A397Q4A7_9HYPH|nr:hypothetical protein [Dichotomicrobium thermohalophilum]RIA55763.1 hypothetical protein BXY53_0839 [Dichotomicrobium thermohalophilum]
MRNAKLMTGVALAALIVGAPAAFAQDNVTVGEINQNVSNDQFVSQPSEGEVDVNNLNGTSTSASSSVTGASAAVAGSFVNNVTNLTFDGDITQRSSNTRVDPDNFGEGKVGSEPANGVVLNEADASVGNLNGTASSASVSATSSINAVSVSFVNGGGSVAGDADITQRASADSFNASGTKNNASINGADIDITGVAASVSDSALGAGSVVTVTGIGKNTSTSLGNVVFGDIDQRSTVDNQRVTNKSNSMDLGTVSGTAASASVSSTGAQNAISVTRIGGTKNTSTVTDIDNVKQVASQEGRDTKVQIGTITGDNVSGTGASVSASATGAINVLSVTGVNAGNDTTISLATDGDDSITQNASNGVNRNTPTETFNETSINVGNVSGKGASASTSATGAASVVSVSKINGGATTATTGNISQTASSSGVVTNTSSVTAGNLTATGTSASISATGASAAVSVSTIQ